MDSQGARPRELPGAPPLSIPLNGFSTVDKGKHDVIIFVAFNSIEWILKYREVYVEKARVALSIPLNGFLVFLAWSALRLG